jgi:hypothetical protein
MFQSTVLFSAFDLTLLEVVLLKSQEAALDGRPKTDGLGLEVDHDGAPRGIALNAKTNLRSDLESTEIPKNEPENEPERTRAGSAVIRSSGLGSASLLGSREYEPENEPETNPSRRGLPESAEFAT